jgi:hypothetical protein
MGELVRCPYCDEENKKSATVCGHCHEAIEISIEEDTSLTKQCPYCDEEILKVAIKCKHCHEWLEKKEEPTKTDEEVKSDTLETKPCPVCSEKIAKDATRCKHCGTWLNEFSKAKYEGTPIQRQDKEVDADVSSAARLIYIECFLIYALLCVFYDIKWWQGLIGYSIVFILLSITWIRLIYCFAASFVWGILAVTLAPFVFDEDEVTMGVRLITDDFSDYWWFGIAVGIISLILHLPAISKDYNRV